MISYDINTQCYIQEYSSATANMFTAVISAVLFPDKFRLTLFIVLAIALLLTGIFCYEKKSLKPATPPNNKCCGSLLL